MKLVGDPNCFYCVSEDSLLHGFLKCENVTSLWRSIELWLRGALNQHYQNLIKSFWIHDGDILVDTSTIYV